ncbi:iron-sulfur cluster co-chaperone protein HscB, mitochondrial [Silurus meridionalis]|nr:iron-sulfur cluster co-chaperone protein HscB, mitochondrial [Silurus meridionalis]
MPSSQSSSITDSGRAHRDQTFDLDARKLQVKYLELQRSLHPDNFSQKSQLFCKKPVAQLILTLTSPFAVPQTQRHPRKTQKNPIINVAEDLPFARATTEQKYSEEQSSLVNKAYRTLQKPITRSAYLSIDTSSKEQLITSKIFDLCPSGPFDLLSSVIIYMQDMYEDSVTTVKCAVGTTDWFKVEVGLHQGSVMSPFLFAVVIDRLIDKVRQESPWAMIFAIDVICVEIREQVEKSLERWRYALERRGMKLQLQGVELEEGTDSTADPALLSKVMEVNERLAETQNIDEVNAVGQEVQVTLKNLTEQMNASLNKGIFPSSSSPLDMYEDSVTTVKCAVGTTDWFKVEVGLHQGSVMSPFLFAVVMDRLIDKVRQESPWTMIFAIDVICVEIREQVEKSLER